MSAQATFLAELAALAPTPTTPAPGATFTSLWFDDRCGRSGAWTLTERTGPSNIRYHRLDRSLGQTDRPAAEALAREQGWTPR